MVMENVMCNACSNENIYFITLDVAYHIKSITSRENIRKKLIENKINNIGEFLTTCLDGSIYQDY